MAGHMYVHTLSHDRQMKVEKAGMKDALYITAVTSNGIGLKVGSKCISSAEVTKHCYFIIMVT